MSNVYALILAGGSGTRFWPLSRNKKPKHLLNLFSEQTLLEQTLNRLDGFVSSSNTFILTNEIQIEGVRANASSLPAENIFAEPMKRDTAPAIALGVGMIAARDSEATVIILPADHLVSDQEKFQQTLRDGITVAQNQQKLVTLGIKPTWPCPSYGYIEKGTLLTESQHLLNPAYSVKSFREKPNKELAEQFLQSNDFSWNAGMFIWTIPTVIRELEKHAPELSHFIEKIQQAPDPSEFVGQHFANLTPISIDYALMEKSSNVVNIQAHFDWDDIGSWISAAKYLKKESTNQSNSPLHQIDSQNNIIYTPSGETHVALLGVQDLIVVQTEDTILVANRHQADEIKQLVDKIPSSLQ